MTPSTRNLIIGLVATTATAACAPGRLPLAAVSTPLATAVSACGLDTSVHVDILDGGHTLTFQGDGEEDPGLAYDDVDCLLAAAGVTGAVAERIDQTRALDGRQDAAWGDYEASWTFHPDAGLNILVTWEGR